MQSHFHKLDQKCIVSIEMNKLKLLIGVVHDIHFIAKFVFFFFFFFFCFLCFFGLFVCFFILLQNTFVHIQVITEIYVCI